MQQTAINAMSTPRAAVLFALVAGSFGAPANRAARAVCSVEVEVDSMAPSSGWAKKTTIPAASGSSYFTWVGANHFPSAQAGKFGLMSYTVNVPTTGTYKVSVRNFHGELLF